MALVEMDFASGGGGAKVKSFMLTPSDTWNSSSYSFWIWDFDTEDASVYTRTKGTIENDYFNLYVSGSYILQFKKDGYYNGELKTAGTSITLGYTATYSSRNYYLSFDLD